MLPAVHLFAANLSAPTCVDPPLPVHHNIPLDHPIHALQECLHHKKKGARAEAITNELEKREAAGTLPEGVRDLLTKDFKSGIPK